MKRPADRFWTIRLTPVGFWWIFALIGLGVASFAVTGGRDSVRLTPDPFDPVTLAVIAAVIAGAVSLVVGFLNTRGRIVPRLAMAVLLAAIAGVGMLSLIITEAPIIATHMAFAPARTHSFVAHLPVRRVYLQPQAGPWMIVTKTQWPPLAISDGDHAFILAHPGGWICARVNLQQAGDAVRIPHMRTYSLPDGSVELCPTAPSAL